jgi:glycyl-tRNA synthetase
LKLKPYLAPVSVGVLPLMNKDGLAEKAEGIYADLKQDFDTFLDVSGSIGRRYRRLEEIGTPFAVTIDKITMQDDTVTIRDRDSMLQKRIPVSDLSNFFRSALHDSK